MSNNFYSDLENLEIELQYALKIQAYLAELDKSETSLAEHITALNRNVIALEATIEAAETQKKIERENNRLDRRFGRAVSNMPRLKIVRPESENETSDTTSDDS